MEEQLTIEGSTQDDTRSLFEHLLGADEHLTKAGLSYHGITRMGQPIGSGVPEIAQLVIALGSAGAFVALSEVMRTFFAKRPRGTFTVRRRDGKRSTLVIGEDMTPDAIAKAIAAVFRDDARKKE